MSANITTGSSDALEVNRASEANGTKKSSKLCSMKITAIHGIKQPAAWAIAEIAGAMESIV